MSSIVHIVWCVFLFVHIRFVRLQWYRREFSYVKWTAAHFNKRDSFTTKWGTRKIKEEKLCQCFTRTTSPFYIILYYFVCEQFNEYVKHTCTHTRHTNVSNLQQLNIVISWKFHRGIDGLAYESLTFPRGGFLTIYIYSRKITNSHFKFFRRHVHSVYIEIKPNIGIAVG